MHDTSEPAWRYIVRRVPEYEDVISRLGPDYLSRSTYLTVASLYEFTVEAFGRGKSGLVTKALALVEEALQSGNDALVDPFSIDFIEALAADRSKTHFEPFRCMLGPCSTQDLTEKLS